MKQNLKMTAIINIEYRVRIFENRTLRRIF